MKKLLAALLILALCLSLCACGGTGNKDHDYILSLLEEGRYDMAIYIIEGLRDGISGNTAAQESSGETLFTELQPMLNGMDWIFEMHLINESNRQLSLVSMEIKNILHGEEMDSYFFPQEELERIGLGGFVLAPNEGRSWGDGHPAVDDFDAREYIFVFLDEQGNEVSMIFSFNMTGIQLKDLGGRQDNAQPSGDWLFPVLLENTGDTPIELFAMDITDFLNGQPLGTSIFEGEESLAQTGLNGLILQPGDTLSWCDGHPAVSDWNAREYRFHFIDPNGQKQTQSFRFDELDKQNQPIDYSQDSGKDLKTLRHDASFELEVFPGIFWVPANTLGQSRFSNMDIHQMLGESPEAKRDNISTLYEALQLYQVGNFTPSDDNIRMMENGINWEHHKPGYHAVRTNTGCCATDSNWLHYILSGDYDEVGYLATSQRDGSGHVYNYILHDGWYYFIDLTHYHASGSPINNAVEDGDMNSYRATDFILGNIHKTQSVQAYVDYVQQNFGDPPGLMFMYTAENVLAVEGRPNGSMVQIIYEEANGQQIDVIFDDPNDQLEFIRMPSPVNLPDWAR